MFNKSSVALNQASLLLVFVSVLAPSYTCHAQCTQWYGGTGLTNSPDVRRFAVWDLDGAGPNLPLLVLGGSFKVGTSSPASDIALWDGITVTNFPTPLYTSVDALTVFNSNLVAAIFSANTADRLKITSDGITWNNLGSGVTGYVTAMTVYGGDLIVAGGFTSVNGVTASNIARWDGTTWHALGTGCNGQVKSLTIWNGKLIAGGDFAIAGGVTALTVAAWDGSSWQSVATGSLLRYVNALEVFNGDLVAGGPSTSNVLIQKIQSGGWQVAAGSTTSGASVQALAVYSGQLVATGNFTNIGGTTASRVAKATTSYTWSAMGGGLNGSFGLGLQVYNGELIVGGDFTTADSMSATGWARWTDTNVPWIADQPTAQAIPVNTDASFSVSPASGYSSLSYQWKRNNVAISNGIHGASSGGGTVSNATTSTVTITGANYCDRGAYTAVVTNSCGAVSSASAQLFFPCQADFNGDLVVDDTDFVTFVYSYNVLDCGDVSMPQCCQADLNGDGVVEDADFNFFIDAYDANLCG